MMGVRQWRGCEVEAGVEAEEAKGAEEAEGGGAERKKVG